ncbi:MAG: SDR family NAD(P)-dependent oxidoreductase [Actinophytocola sp.]|uniref:SDR family NAD(P)-dependent oxidoreductase n=1 Tax=Actinophytocola sp. TaxID=1872138 RepID=UPI003C71BBD7
MNGKVALITGGGSGIGAACARRLGDDGFGVVVADIDVDAAHRVADAVTAAGGAGRAHRVDVSDPLSVRELLGVVLDRCGRLDVVVNCAGIAGPLVPVVDYPIDAFDAVMRTNVNGVFYVMRAALPTMLGSGGVIVNIASVAGSAALRTHCAYVAAKHAVIGLTKAAAREYAGNGVRVVSVSPGVIDSPMTEALPRDRLARVLQSVPLGKPGRPEDVADLVAYLTSDSAWYITGSDHPVDGGFLTR